jgi:hypothetical protein
VLRHDQVALNRRFYQLRAIAHALDDARPASAAALITEANGLVRQHIVVYEREDERRRLSPMESMSRAHRELLHLARLLDRLVAKTCPKRKSTDT